MFLFSYKFFLIVSGNMKDLATAMGGSINRQVFDLLLQQLGIDGILSEGTCILPQTPDSKIFLVFNDVNQHTENNDITFIF